MILKTLEMSVKIVSTYLKRNIKQHQWVKKLNQVKSVSHYTHTLQS